MAKPLSKQDVPTCSCCGKPVDLGGWFAIGSDDLTKSVIVNGATGQMFNAEALLQSHHKPKGFGN